MHGELHTDLALDYYSQHTGQIEVVRSDRTMEQIVFPIPEICEYLTTETMHRVFVTAERDDQNSKVTDFFHQHEKLFTEMLWQKKLRGWFCETASSCAIIYIYMYFFSTIFCVIIFPFYLL